MNHKKMPKLTLSIIEGKQAGKKYQLTKKRTILGSGNTDISIKDNSITKKHAALEIVDNRYMIRDLGSKNGTFINDQRIDSAFIKHTDELRLGSCRMLFIVTDADFVAALGQDVAEVSTSRMSIQQESESIKNSMTKATTLAQTIDTPQKASISVEFRFLSGPDKGKKLVVKKQQIVLGRGSQADLVINDDEVSRKHAAFDLLSINNVFIKDLSSANGTYLNNDKITNSRVKNGDEIKVGQTILKVTIIRT